VTGKDILGRFLRRLIGGSQKHAVTLAGAAMVVAMISLAAPPARWFAWPEGQQIGPTPLPTVAISDTVAEDNPSILPIAPPIPSPTEMPLEREEAHSESEGQSPSSDDGEPVSRPQEAIGHVVREGETLSGIADRHGVSVESILWANGGVNNPDLLSAGQELTVPPATGVLHTVLEGDTLLAVAALYRAVVGAIVEANALQEPYLVVVGQRLIVPGGRPPEPPKKQLPLAALAQPAPAQPSGRGGTAESQQPARAPGAGASRTRVGIQAGHWRSAELPAELAGLRSATGTSGGGVPEWRLNLDIARRVAALLQGAGVEVDIIPATVPPRYQADAFVALHADGQLGGTFSGFKLASASWSTTAAVDDKLISAITDEYRVATNMPIDTHITRNMTGYYAFNYRRYQYAVAPTTPSVILEMGFMTNRSDLQVLLGKQDTVAAGIARGILRFLGQG